MAETAETVLPPRARASLVGALIGASSAAWIAFSAPPNALALIPLLAIAVLCSALAAAKHPAWRPTLALGLALLALLLGPGLFFVIIRVGLGETQLVKAVCPGFSPFEPDVALDYAVLAVLAFLPLAIGGAVTFLLARFLTQRARFLAHPLRAASLAAVASTFALLAWAMPRILHGSDPGRYIESLPVVGSLPPAEGSPSRILKADDGFTGPPVPPPPAERTVYTTRVYEVPLPQNLVAQRYCPSFYSGCSLLIKPAGSTLDDSRFSRPRIVTSANMWDCDPRSVNVAENDAFLVREDAPHGLLILDGPVRYALDLSTHDFKGLRTKEVMDATSSPPYGWIAIAAAGLLVAAFLEYLRFRARRRLRRIAKAPAGMLGADGWLVLSDAASPLRVELHARLRPGPVLVMSREWSAASQGPYRGDALPDDLEILPGERAEILARERWVSLSPIDAVTFAMVVVAATPLAAFWHG